MPLISSLAGLFGYGRGRSSIAMYATGGSEVFNSGGFRYHVFDGPGTLNVQSYIPSATVEILVVGGGGGGGNYYYCGGSGAGGLVHVTNYPVSLLASPSPSVPITVGGGGAYPSNNGSNSSVRGLTALGGGYGGGYPYGLPGNPGGSGGAGSLYVSSRGTATQPGQPQSVGNGTLQRNIGTDGGYGPGWPGNQYGGGGGGGAGSAGENSPSKGWAGHGGVGLQFPQFSRNSHPGLSSLLPQDGGFAGGGGGGFWNSAPAQGIGGIYNGTNIPTRYGGGNGGYGSSSSNASSGAARTGGGAGGPDYPQNVAGGSGIVVIRYSYSGN